MTKLGLHSCWAVGQGVGVVGGHRFRAGWARRTRSHQNFVKSWAARGWFPVRRGTAAHDCRRGSAVHSTESAA